MRIASYLPRRSRPINHGSVATGKAVLVPVNESFLRARAGRFRIGFHKQESILRTADCIYEIAECNFREIPEDVIAGIPMGECGEGKAAY
jgi:hypothetical protein